MYKYKLSIITINFNNVEGLEKTINSIVDQNWKEFEYILIDGGSTDGSKELIEKFSTEVDFWVSEADDGIYHAMNKGVQKAEGEYLLFLNSGDILLNNNVLAIVKNELKDFDHVCFNSRYGNSVNSSEEKIYNTNILDHLFFFKSTLIHPSTFSRKKVFIDVGGFDQRLKICSDWKFFYTSILKQGCSYKFVNRTTSFYNTDGISSSFVSGEIIRQEKKMVIDEEFPFLYDNLKELNAFKLVKRSKLIKILVFLGLLKIKL